MSEHNGRLPLEIRAVPEGTIVPTGNVLKTVENTDPECYWLTNYVETILTHVWYGSTVATQSKAVKNNMEKFLGETGDLSNIGFMLHDFGFRGASSLETAAVGGAAHLINFLGTDTLAGMEYAGDYYDAKLDSLAFSVPATEHSIMTSLGSEGEYEILDNLLENYPSGILGQDKGAFAGQRNLQPFLKVASLYNEQKRLERLINKSAAGSYERKKLCRQKVSNLGGLRDIVGHINLLKLKDDGTLSKMERVASIDREKKQKHKKEMDQIVRELRAVDTRTRIVRTGW